MPHRLLWPHCLAAGLLLTLWTAVVQAGESTPLRVLSDQPLPDPLRRADDVRWAGPGSVFIAAAMAGAFEVEIGKATNAPPQLIIAPVPVPNYLRHCSRLGVSDEYIVSACPIRSVFWKPRSSKDPDKVQTELSFDAIVDLDVWKGRLLLLGARRDAQRRFAPDGAIAWTASLGEQLTEVKPLMYSVSGPGARNMDACGIMDLGKVRFLPDGSFVIAPGVEPGIFLYDAAGKLKRTWQADLVGFDAGCGISDEQMYSFSESFVTRYQWINQRRVLDEILPLADGLGFVIRTRSAGQTRWQLKVLGNEGGVSSYELPFTSAAEYAHVRGDVRDGRIVFLLLDRFKDAPPNSARLLLAELPQVKKEAKPQGQGK